METTTEAVTVLLSRSSIESDLASLAPDVQVVGSRMEETGWTLLLEGVIWQIECILYWWEEVSI